MIIVNNSCFTSLHIKLFRIVFTDTSKLLFLCLLPFLMYSSYKDLLGENRMCSVLNRISGLILLLVQVVDISGQH
jgi:hypothetical protein